ncbi:Hpr(Ser) kinase/phosphatase [Nitrobacter hamburgensis X14]|uniref:Hpr(Ser) kinase/phosphatase n=1 Tax=Nitrobacter hamburgensis (strain DSM 10229 / NCIMB 13809 / X14) TaxID=323097 RepID=Q1QR16_NITHX|nr:HPr kinase/phosphatase C-terminal domain-containing protein [Nitrobacter hamburgensis]ABE61331.1 Hpr(Ser) kinase/phosphatase [Nitrobacter hamburgensis X14]
MTASSAPTIHGSAVLVGDRAVLIRGPSGAGKSRLAFDLILAGRSGQLPAATLVGDDRLCLEPVRDRLLVRPPPELEGLMEIRGLGIRRCAYVAEAPVGLVIDLDAPDAERLPPLKALRTTILAIELARIPVAAGFSPLPIAIAALTTVPGCSDPRSAADCREESGNHI